MSNLLSLDPGNTTGWAIFSLETGDVTKYGIVVGKPNFYKLLDDWEPDKIVCEDYHLFPWKSKEQSWSDLFPVRLIGAVEYWCDYHDVPLIMQKPNIKGIAYKWAGMEPPKSHKDTHATDAYVHGVYYLQSIGIRKPQQGRVS